MSGIRPCCKNKSYKPPRLPFDGGLRHAISDAEAEHVAFLRPVTARDVTSAPFSRQPLPTRVTHLPGAGATSAVCSVFDGVTGLRSDRLQARTTLIRLLSGSAVRLSVADGRTDDLTRPDTMGAAITETAIGPRTEKPRLDARAQIADHRRGGGGGGGGSG